MEKQGEGINDQGHAPIESVDRALRLILLLRSKDEISIKEAANELEVATSTMHRLFSTLVLRGFAIRTPERKYKIGPEGLAAYPNRSIDTETFVEHAMLRLPILRDEVGETVQVMELRGQNICFLDGVESTSMLRVSYRKGDEMPAFASAGGKAILAAMGNDEIEQLFKDGIPSWPLRRYNTVESLLRAMTRIRKDNYALSHDETIYGVCGVGAAIKDNSGKPIGAITIAVPSARFTNDRMSRFTQSIQAAARDIERGLNTF